MTIQYYFTCQFIYLFFNLIMFNHNYNKFNIVKKLVKTMILVWNNIICNERIIHFQDLKIQGIAITAIKNLTKGR